MKHSAIIVIFLGNILNILENFLEFFFAGDHWSQILCVVVRMGKSLGPSGHGQILWILRR